jgi:predicted NBD/HSP70 family sugar kinase
MQPVRVGSKELIREINSSLLLAELRTGLLSRTELAKRTGLSLPTVSEIVADLLARGIVEERETAASGGGRKPVLLALRAAAGHVIGIKVTETDVIAVRTDLNAGIVDRAAATVPADDVRTVVRVIAQVVRRLRPKDGPLYGVGVGLAGVVDRSSGVVRHATYADWRDVDLAGLLEKKLGVPVVVDNDVNTLVANEQWFGAGRGVSDMAVVSIGRGIGLGMVLDGRLYRGAGGGAGEFGHLKVADGPACVCGGRGCLEAVIGGPAILARTGQVTLDDAAQLARDGDAAARAVFDEVGRILGTAVGNLVNLLNPKLIVLAGEGTRAAELMLPGFDETLRSSVFDGLQQDLEVVVDEWDDEAWARGAAGLFLGELFQPNLRPDEAGRPSLTSRSAG